MTNHKQIKQFADELRENLKNNLFNYELKAHGLVTAFMLDSSISQDRFNSIAERFARDDKAVVNLTYLENAVLKLVGALSSNRVFSAAPIQ